MHHGISRMVGYPLPDTAPPPDTRPGDLPWTSEYPLPASDNSWWSLETCSNLFIWGASPEHSYWNAFLLKHANEMYISHYVSVGLDPDINPDEEEEKRRLITQVLELQNTLDGKFVNFFP